jgi:conjugative transposon TraN protein
VNDFIVANNPSTADNILSVKANSKSFKRSSNLTVATSDGQFYNFEVIYKDKLDQTNLYLKDLSNQEVDKISVNKYNNTHLIFPVSIKYIDFGNGEFIQAIPAENLQNVVRVSVLDKFDRETNISVYTEDKSFHTFDIVYNENETNYSFQIGKANESFALLNEEELTDKRKSDILRKISKKGRNMNHLGINKNKISFSVNNIFVDANKIIFRFMIHNKSNIKYDIDYIKFFIEDKKITKKTAIQEVELQPLFIDLFSKSIEGKTKSEVSVCFEKFTIPDNKNLIIEINEKNGGRHILYKLNNSDIIDAETLL